MGLMIRILLALMFVISITTASFAAWQGPAEIMSGVWGSGVGQFGLEQGDSGDDFPEIEAIIPDGKIVISDTVNKKQLVFNNDGSFIKEVKWMMKLQSGGRTTYGVPAFSFGSVLGYSSDGNIYTSSGNNYFLKSPTGQLISTSTTRPLELGVVSEQSLGGGKYKITITYSDMTYSILGGPFEKYQRDSAGRLNAISGTYIKKYNQCGKALGSLALPQNQSTVVSPGGRGFDERRALIAEYGSPVVAPNGDVYTWKRTPDAYSILKWTWVDDPNVPSGPDAPTNLSVAASINGLYLTWTASPQDPGCVTGYEVSRATSVGGVGTTVGTVNAGTVKYNDASASSGTTYYYKVRAVSGSEYSTYTSEVSGKR